MTNPFALAQVKNPLVKACLRSITKLDVLERYYDDWLYGNGGQHGEPTDFIQYVLSRFNVGVQIVNEEHLTDLPRTGSLIIVANHPLGGLEGMLLTQLLLAVRPDLKVLTNEILSAIPEFKDVFIGVDVLNTGRERHNMKGMRSVARHLSGGGALLVFPAGTVSRLKFPSLALFDAPWNSMVSKLARQYSAPIMPIFVKGRNRLPFYLSGYIHKRLRTLLLPRAMLNKSGETIQLKLGTIIQAADLRKLKDDVIAMDYIRVCCTVLDTPVHTCSTSEQSHMNKIKDDVDTQHIVAHLAALNDFVLYEQAGFKLYCAPYERLGPVMEQLSIEREKTFRQVDEGTGLELDSDRFDPHYMHLFLWDETAQKIAGGYRLGKTNEIIENRGLGGLYSHSLFDYNAHFLSGMGKTIEVGRSFIVQDYQKNPAALDILWKGIGRFVAKNPEYHTLFGCVSISRQYSNLVRAMLTETFLTHYGATETVMNNVRARTPIKNIKKPWTSEQLTSLSAIPMINKLVGRIDTGKSIPVLIRHYLALNGRFISFTVNDEFGQSLDGLIMVDLRQSQERYLKRYMGEAGLASFKAQHNTERTLDLLHKGVTGT